MKQTQIDVLREAVAARLTDACERAYGVRPSDLTVGFPLSDKKAKPGAWLGDFSLTCYTLCEELGEEDPNLIAQRLGDAVETDEYVVGVDVVGPYVNIHIQPDRLFGAAIDGLPRDLDAIIVSDPERIMVEYLSPNTNKPLHMGHVRNGAIGEALANMFRAVGHQVIRANLVNDRGVHICKSMWLYQEHGEGIAPKDIKMKGDHFVGGWYVAYGMMEKLNPNLARFPQAMLRLWEEADPEVRSLWHTMNEWVYAGFDETYRRYGFHFEVFYFESDTYTLGKDIIQSGLQRDVFVKHDNGSVVIWLPESEFRLNQEGQRKFVSVLREDGTSVYMTQDIGTAQKKFEEHHLDRSVYVVANEQNYHFQCLFYILRALGYEWASRCHHMSYGMVDLPDGKMKSREGTTVDADKLLDDVTQAIVDLMIEREKELKKNAKPFRFEDEEAMRPIAEKIALACIKIYLLKQEPYRRIVYDPAASIALEGETGRYLLYTYTRCFSILRSARKSRSEVEPDFSGLDSPIERMLARQILCMPEAVVKGAEEMSPAVIVTAIMDLASAFNQFYAHVRVFDDDVPEEVCSARLGMVAATERWMKLALDALDIETLDKM